MGHDTIKTAIALGGHAWERAGRIWYEALCDKRMKSNSTFQDFANLTVGYADRLFGGKSQEMDAIRKGWGHSRCKCRSQPTVEESRKRQEPKCLIP
jgi:hypothetical protein